MIVLYIKLCAHASVSPLYRTYIVKKRFARYAYIRNRCPFPSPQKKEPNGFQSGFDNCPPDSYPPRGSPLRHQKRKSEFVALILKRCQKLSPGQFFSKGFPFPSPKKKERICRSFFFGDSKGIRTPVAAVRGLSLNRLTMEPYIYFVSVPP